MQDGNGWVRSPAGEESNARYYHNVSGHTAYVRIGPNKFSNWGETTSTPCCFPDLPVETARALQM